MPADRRQRPFFLRRLPLEHETAVYLLVSALDVFMTYIVLRHNENLPPDGPRFVESNAVARFFLHHWGMRGLIYFKFGMTGFVCLVVQIIATQRLETARRVLQLAIVVVSAVVIYSLSLYLRAG